MPDQRSDAQLYERKVRQPAALGSVKGNLLARATERLLAMSPAWHKLESSTARIEGELVSDERKITQLNKQSQRRVALQHIGDVVLTTASRYLVARLIPLIGLVVVWGPPKCGKSFWIFD